MTALLPLAMALQGIGYATHLLATQGLLPEEEDTPTDPPNPQPVVVQMVNLAPRRSRGKPYTQLWPRLPATPEPRKRTRRHREREALLFL
jgi:hypothetical protein